MPTEISNPDIFLQKSEQASQCAVKRSSDIVKLKLRTPSQLYTLKVKPAKAEKLIKKLRCEILEI